MSNEAQELMSQAPARTRGHLARFSACLLAIVTSFIVSGCQSVSGTSIVTSQVRIIDASPDAPAVDIYQGSNPVAYNLGFGTATSYIPISPGLYDFTADTTGTRQVLTTARATFATGGQYTVLISNIAASLQEIVIKDQGASAPSGNVSLRFLDEGTATGAVDVYLVPSGSAITAVSPLVTGFTFGTNSGYLNVPAGAYKVVIYPTGSVPTATSVGSYTGSLVTYSSGAARTLIILDSKLLASPAAQIITVSDYDSPSATS
ncbi:DUF4397 domain-containing protein [Granulicella sibirica]|uniref:DUF4397 domain-containing protein n=1 Tax=Granulicella sibirica TaxID=2479048 RepID=UPI001F4F356B|nr:DUF4397 domain-containing protein [Granulicella sibirica]